MSTGPRERVQCPRAGQICASLHFMASFRDEGRAVVRVATISPWPSRPGRSARTSPRNATTTCRGCDWFSGERAILVRAVHPARFSTRCGGRPAALRKEGISHCNLRPRQGVKIQALQPEWFASRLDTWFMGHSPGGVPSLARIRPLTAGSTLRPPHVAPGPPRWRRAAGSPLRNRPGRKRRSSQIRTDPTLTVGSPPCCGAGRGLRA